LRLFSGLLALALFAPLPLLAHGPWVTLTDCRYLPNPSDDGDSFHVRAKNKEYIFRLYFVDTPETDPHLAERLDEQSKYFGISVPQTIQLGEYAKAFTKEKLSRPFVVRTCMQDALGRSKIERFYAFVESDHQDLSEELVANGLARLHGASAKPAGLNNPEVEWQKLESLERVAKQAKIGGWGAYSGRMNVRAAKRSTAPVDSFTAFFHPEKLAPANQPSPSPSAAAKLNVNTATAAELEEIPGVGPVMSARIIAARPFQSADDLRQVKGIGQKTFEKLRPYFY
jgi:competence ComEA-like helix-hairpin-helix protein